MRVKGRTWLSDGRGFGAYGIANGAMKVSLTNNSAHNLSAGRNSDDASIPYVKIPPDY